MTILNFKFYKSGIAKRLITYMVIFSAVITALITIIQLLLDYNRDVDLINDQLQKISQIHLKSLTASLWSVDNKELKIHLEGILKTRDIQFLEVREKETTVISLGSRNANNVISQSYPMIYTQRNRENEIGTLIVEASLDGVYQRLIDKVWVILISNAVKTFFVAAFMLIVFYQLNTRHLIKIAEYASGLKADNLNNELKLYRKIKHDKKEDELELVVTSINKMQRNIHQSFVELQQSEERANKLSQELQQYQEHLEDIVRTRTAEFVAAKDDAEAANLAKSDFLSNMSHEFRTPLNAILGFAQIIELDDSNSKEMDKSNIREVLNAGYHLLDLVNDVLYLAKIESGKLVVSMEEVCIDTIIKECHVLIKNQAEENKLHILDQLSNNEYTVQADPTRLKQVLLNLLSNAVKYNSKKGSITIEGKIIGSQRLRISITDSGPGLTQDEISSLFISFERLNKTDNVEGTGIGLVITKHLVDIMNGQMGVVSTPGVGSSFWFELDVA